MRPSGRLTLDPEQVVATVDFDGLLGRLTKSLRQGRVRATGCQGSVDWLFFQVVLDLAAEPELSTGSPPGTGTPDWIGRTLSPVWRDLLVGTGQRYPPMLTWLTRGDLGRRRNFLGIGLIRSLPYIRHRFERVAEVMPWRVDLHEAAMAVLRQRINQTPDVTKATTVVGTHAGIGAGTDLAVIGSPLSPTVNGLEDAKRLVQTMASGCIAVSGPRGSGKSTLVRAFCRAHHGYDAAPGLRLAISAPLRYRSRDFLIHLYSCLCDAVIRDPRFNQDPPRDRATETRWAAAALLAGASAVGLGWFAVTGHWPLPSHISARVAAGLGALLAVLAVLGVQLRLPLLLCFEKNKVVTLAVDARERRRRLHYQRSVVVSREAHLPGPFGSGMSLLRSRIEAEQVMTLPELVDDYRDFVERIVATLRGARRPRPPGHPPLVRLVIGIDELDQIDAADEARAFLDELGAVFAMPYCVYLISVSPAVLAAEEHARPLRTASEGVLDETIWLRPLPLPGIREQLEGQMPRFPPAFSALCFALSGGLPRDAFRLARTIYSYVTDTRGAERVAAEHPAGPPTIGLREAAHRLVTDEIEIFIRRARMQVEALDQPDGRELRSRLDNVVTIHQKLTDHFDGTEPVDIAQAISEFTGVWRTWSSGQVAAASRLGGVANGFVVGLYFFLVVHHVFMTWTGRFAPAGGGVVTADDAVAGHLDPVCELLGEIAHTLLVSPLRAAQRLDSLCGGESLGLAAVRPDFLGAA